MGDAAGKADCGCIYHAEDGIPCEHDKALEPGICYEPETKWGYCGALNGECEHTRFSLPGD